MLAFSFAGGQKSPSIGAPGRRVTGSKLSEVTDQKEQTTGRLALAAVNAGMVAYASNPVARAIVTAIPFGSFFDALVGTAGSNLVLQRLEVLVEELRGAINRVPQEKQDPAVTAEQLIDAAIRAVRGASETASREKVQTIAAALVGGTSVDRPADLDLESALASLVSLTAADLELARVLAERASPFGFSPTGFIGEDSLFHLGHLQAAGLLESVVRPGEDNRARGLGRTEPSIEFRMTPTFHRILALLRAGGLT